ncbi:6-phosphogluconolactonase [Bifidobacterium sp. ESL0784]|uniref:6-phosphogluconolactonase n=1 Tax=Bifidobacterium sp. ESL0784 TaxID=2983231 RepID=UPI0023F668B5|nr:6-phosphogluconolactonase [Bifidobacterium sp. ESL0784]MDF7640785.1 6-phosphogluconolactonase [Bifidobacterium sp. ESL0784]
MADRKLEVYKDAETVAQAAAQRTLLAILDGLGQRDDRDGAKPLRSRYDIALTGGTDILRALTYMASNPLVDAIDFSRVHFWWGDDRFVAATDKDHSSYQARKRFLDKLVADGRLPENNIHEMAADARTLEQVAAASDAENDELLAKATADYEAELKRELGDEPTMDLLILGMGPDGHFASLFPNHDAIRITDSSHLVVGESHSPKMPPLRISMTAPMLARTHCTWMLTCGAGKADATAHVFARPNNPAYPASFAAGTEEFAWFTTSDAVTKL